MKFDIVLLERPIDEGLTRAETMTMFDFLKEDDVFPLEIMANAVESSAIGFITNKTAEQLDYDYAKSGLNKFIADIMDDMTNETATHTYEFNGLNIFLTRNFNKY